jgi:hypothetical protein
MTRAQDLSTFAGKVTSSGNLTDLTVTTNSTFNGRTYFNNSPRITASSSTVATTNAIQGVHTLGQFRTFTPASGAFYFHILLPARYNNAESRMFMLEIKGYDFDGGRVMNMMIGAYITPVSNGGPVSRVAVWDAASYYSPTVYYSTTYNVGVARFYMASRYYSTFLINSICVGNGDIIEPGELRVIESASATL